MVIGISVIGKLQCLCACAYILACQIFFLIWEDGLPCLMRLTKLPNNLLFSPWRREEGR